MKKYLKSYYFLAFIILIGFILRAVWLDKIPQGFTADEAQQGYDAYSILKTGKDEWGVFMPLFPRGFGDYKPPLYTFLSVPVIALLGLNEISTRVLAIIAGTVTIYIVFLIGKEFINNQLGLLSALLVAFSPWHIQLSRTAFEGGIGVLFFSIGFYFLLKFLNSNFKKSFFLNLSFLFFGINLYSYHSWRVLTILFASLAFCLILVEMTKIKRWALFTWIDTLNQAFRKFDFKKIFPAVLLFTFFLTPILFNIDASLKRSSDVGIFSTQSIGGYFKDKATSSIDRNIDRVFDNKFLYLSNQIISNYLSYYSFSFFFTKDRPDESYLNFPSHSLLYLIELPLFLLGIYWLVKKCDIKAKLVLIWFILAPIPASLTDNLNAHRAITFLPLTSLLSSLGFYYLYQITQKKNILKNLFIITLLFSLINFIFIYFFKVSANYPTNLRVGYKEVFTKALNIEDEYSSIVFSRVFSMPHIFVAFYKKMDPRQFQYYSKDWLRYEKANKLYVDQLESYNLGKYEFKDIKWDLELKKENQLLISSPENFPEDVISLLDIKNSHSRVLYRLVSTDQN